MLTDDALRAMTRRERVEAIWAALKPPAKECAWDDLSPHARVDAIALFFDATEFPPPGRLPPNPGETHAAVVDRWMRERDR